jgi:hypothetical protein
MKGPLAVAPEYRFLSGNRDPMPPVERAFEGQSERQLLALANGYRFGARRSAPRWKQRKGAQPLLKDDRKALCGIAFRDL